MLPSEQFPDGEFGISTQRNLSRKASASVENFIFLGWKNGACENQNLSAQGSVVPVFRQAPPLQ